MKKILLLLTVLMLGGLVTKLQAQRRDVTIKDIPQAVANSFNNAYHSVKSEWRKVGNDFEASFEENGEKTYVVYGDDGKVVRKEVEIHNGKLPSSAMVYVNKTYKEDEVHHVRKITNADGSVSYRAEVKDKIVYFDENGNFIKEVKITED